MQRPFMIVACLVCLYLPSLLVAQDAPGTITTIAGGGTNFSDLSIPAAQISFGLGPTSVYADVGGNVYITSGGSILQVGLDGIIRGFVRAPGIPDQTLMETLGDGRLAAIYGYIGGVGVIATTAMGQSVQPMTYSGMVVGARGNAYLTDGAHHRIRRVDSNGIIWTTAGTGNASQTMRVGGGFSGDGGLATQAQLNLPMDVAQDARGNLYVADFGNNRIRQITPDGFISTLAGSGGSISGPSGDGGPASRAILSAPISVAVDVKGNVYIAEYYPNRIRRVSSDQIITTFAGTGSSGYSGDGGPATQARLNFPSGVAVDGAGNVYIADQGNNCIRRVDQDGVITTLAGTGRAGYSGDGGPAIQAALDTPTDVSVDPKGYVYIADFQNRRIRRVSPLKPLAVPSVNLSVSSLIFETTNVGATSELTVTISNPGNAPLSVTRIGVEGKDFSQFQVSPTVATVDTGASLTVRVRFTPASSGLKSAALSIEHNAAGSPLTMPLSGQGVPAIASFRSADFTGDGKVDFDDFFLFAAAFGQSATGDNAKFDLDGNGKIDLDDFFLFAAKFGK